LDTGIITLIYNWKPAPFGLAMLVGFGSFWFVSIITKREDPERIDAFFDRMRRKSDADVPEGAEKPLAETTGDDLLLLDIPGWTKRTRWKNFFSRYREDLVGFVLSWLVVGLLILLAWWILQFG
jgi:hypothetical protein